MCFCILVLLLSSLRLNEAQFFHPAAGGTLALMKCYFFSLFYFRPVFGIYQVKLNPCSEKWVFCASTFLSSLFYVVLFFCSRPVFHATETSLTFYTKEPHGKTSNAGCVANYFLPTPSSRQLDKVSDPQKKKIFSLVINKLKNKIASFFIIIAKCSLLFFPPAFHSPGDIICAMFILKVWTPCLICICGRTTC